MPALAWWIKRPTIPSIPFLKAFTLFLSLHKEPSIKGHVWLFISCSPVDLTLLKWLLKRGYRVLYMLGISYFFLYLILTTVQKQSPSQTSPSWQVPDKFCFLGFHLYSLILMLHQLGIDGFNLLIHRWLLNSPLTHYSRYTLFYVLICKAAY